MKDRTVIIDNKVFEFRSAELMKRALVETINDGRFMGLSRLTMLADTVYCNDTGMFTKSRDIGQARLNELLSLSKQNDSKNWLK